MIQAVVNRLAGNSFTVKGWSVALVSALLVLAARATGRLPFAGASPSETVTNILEKDLAATDFDSSHLRSSDFSRSGATAATAHSRRTLAFTTQFLFPSVHSPQSYPPAPRMCPVG